MNAIVCGSKNKHSQYCALVSRMPDFVIKIVCMPYIKNSFMGKV